MKKYDVIVIGSGSGMLIVDEALNHGLNVALVEKGPLGGTCLNFGCIPSKMLITPADRIVDIQKSKDIGINARITDIDFKSIMQRMRQLVEKDRGHIKDGVSRAENLDYYEGNGHFVDDYTVEVNGQRIKGKKILIACGARPFIPFINGLDNVNYLTSETILELDAPPQSIVIIGGGYISVEYGHFLAAMGTKVTILEMADRLISNEEPEIAALLERELSKRMTIHLGFQAKAVRGYADGVSVVAIDKANGNQSEINAQSVLVASGRKSNADILKLENTGVTTDAKVFIKVNQELETTRENIWAVGDANGQYMFTHVANREAAIASENILHQAGIAMDYSTIPHAIFSYPQIAAVGLTEATARKNHSILVGRASYSDVAKGVAMAEKTGFAKAIIERDTKRILGFHIIGPYAPIIIQEVTNAMATKGNITSLSSSLHIHPALSELILRTLNNLEET